MIVAIDGPAGSGKSTVSKKLAKEMEFIYLDTGAMYRSVALFCYQNNIDYKSEFTVAEFLDNISIHFAYEDGINKIFLNNKEVTDDIRTSHIGEITSSYIASYKSVRDWLLPLQRNLAGENNCILDGRDIGTTVFPNAELKIFLTASSEERAKRRMQERGELSTDIYNQTLDEIVKRDEADTKRQHSPLQMAKDAVIIDTTNLTIFEVCQKISNIIKEKGGAND